MKRDIVRISLVLVGLVMLAKLLAFIRDPVVAAIFGASGQTDAFFSALTIGTFVFAFLAPVITASVVPLFIEARTNEGENVAWRKVSGTVLVLTACLVLMCGLVAWSAPWLVGVFNPGYTGATREIAAHLTRLLAPLMALMPLSFLMMTLLNAEKKFFTPGLLPAVGNATVLLVMMLLYHRLGIDAVGWATLVGAGIQLFVVGMVSRGRLRLRGLRWNETMDFISKLARRSGPVLLAAVVFNLNFVLMMRLGSLQPEGTYSYLTYGIRMQQVFLDILFASFATVIFPFLAERALAGPGEGFKELALFGLKTFTLVLVPLTAILVALREPLTELIFRKAAGTPAVLTGISTAMAFFAISLLAFGLAELVNRTYFALHDSRTPMVVTILGTAAAFVFYFTIGGLRSGLGLALAYSLGACVTAGVGAFVLHRRLGWGVNVFMPFLGKIILAGGLTGVVAEVVRRVLLPLPGTAWLWTALMVLLVVGISTATLLVALRWMRVKETEQVWEVIRDRLLKRPAKADDA